MRHILEKERKERKKEREEEEEEEGSSFGADEFEDVMADPEYSSND